ncbi:hypothetical protein ACWEPL_31040 [Nonomuraea sp. NPDC004186]
MFSVYGYQFAPRHADISDTPLWWIDTAMLESGLTTGTRATNGWGAFNSLGLCYRGMIGAQLNVGESRRTRVLSRQPFP